jgi:GntR family transcriptional regulator
MVTDAWVPQRVGGHVTARALQTRALYEILMDEGIKFGRVVQEVTAISADPELAGLLQVDIGSPLLRMVRVLYDRRRLPVQHLTIYVTSERSRILMDVSAGAINTVGAGQIVHDYPGPSAGPEEEGTTAGRNGALSIESSLAVAPRALPRGRAVRSQRKPNN